MKIIFATLGLLAFLAGPAFAASDAWLLSTYTCSNYAADYGLGKDNCLTLADVGPGETLADAKIAEMRDIMTGGGAENDDD